MAGFLDNLRSQLALAMMGGANAPDPVTAGGPGGGLPGETARDKAALQYNLARGAGHSYAYTPPPPAAVSPAVTGSTAAPAGGGGATLPPNVANATSPSSLGTFLPNPTTPTSLGGFMDPSSLATSPSSLGGFYDQASLATTPTSITPPTLGGLRVGGQRLFRLPTPNDYAPKVPAQVWRR